MDDSRIGGGLNASIVPSSSGDVQRSPRPADPRIENVAYESSDSVTLQGRLLERGPGKEIVLFLHGNGCKAAWLDNWLHDLSVRFDANVMAAEYRGFNDDVVPTEKGVLADSLAARDYLCNRYQVSPNEVVLYGESLGGGCAVAVAANGGAKALILERTFDRMVDVASNLYPYVPVRWLMRNRYDSLAKLTVYHGPLIMVHGTEDELIPMEHGRRLYDSAHCQPKHWIEVRGIGHNEPLPPQVLEEVTQTFRRFTTNDP